jgi:hypothetical protein
MTTILGEMTEYMYLAFPGEALQLGNTEEHFDTRRVSMTDIR